MLVIDANKEESVSRSGLPRRRSVAGIQHVRQARGRSFPGPHFNQSPDDGTDHVFEKPIAVGFDGKMVTAASQGQPLEIASRLIVVREAPFER